MSVTAYNAQGTTLKVGATATAKTITAISKAAAAVLTIATHGLTDGTVLKIAAVVGMTEINGKVGVVTVVDANNVKLNGVNSVGYTTYTSGGTATPTQAQVGNFKDWSGFGGQSSDIEATDLDSTAKEFRAGLQDNGELQIQVQVSDTDDGQQALRGSQAASGPLTPMVLTFANGKTRTFSAYVKSSPEQGGVDALITGSFTMRISGSVVRG